MIPLPPDKPRDLEGELRRMTGARDAAENSRLAILEDSYRESTRLRNLIVRARNALERHTPYSRLFAELSAECPDEDAT